MPQNPEAETSTPKAETSTSEPQPTYRKEGILLPPTIPNIKDWPIAKLLKRKEAFVEPVVAEAMTQLLEKKGQEARDLIEQTMYLERIRIREEPWKVDPKDEYKVWSDIKRQLVKLEQEETPEEARKQTEKDILEEVTRRYADEISSVFRPGTYHFAKRALPFMFSILLNASAGKTLKSIIYDRLGLQDKIKLTGEVEALRTLSQKGTIVLVPTHFSNVDSILIGWGLHALGLPAFIYGAGLNLFNNKILAYFMSRIGAYKLDRRKRNPIYRAALDAYSTLAMEKGVHTLFFPGGTRSRTGMIEKKLKLGLLGTAMEAQRRAFLPGGDEKKIFIVPLVMSYHFVLEGKSLINQHLKQTGQENYYILDDEFSSYRKFIQFVWKAFGKTSEISLNFGKPLDMMGNFVDIDGKSHDPLGREVDIKEYFMTHGRVEEDVQRDRVYTRMLGDRIVERFHAENVVYSSHLLAFVVFQMLKKRHPQFDLYALLRIPEEDRHIDKKDVVAQVSILLDHLKQKRDAGQIHLAEHLNRPMEDMIAHALRNLGMYHSKHPLKYLNDDTLGSESMNLLYFYHNRLIGYDLEQYISA